MKPKICFVVAISGTANSFLRDHIEALRKNYDVYLAGNIESEEEISQLKINGYFKFDIRRSISLFNDIKALWQLYRYFKKMKFEAVHSVTPKAGITTALAGRLAGIKHRIHIFTGQVWATKHGFMRFLLKSIDKLTATLDNHILVDGESQREYIVKNGIVSEQKSRVLGAGSISGVNINRFTPSKSSKEKVCQEIGLTSDRIVFTFMGRANKEKGVGELLCAFNDIAQTHPEAFLLFFGSDEDGSLTRIKEYHNIVEGENFCFYGRTSAPGIYLQASDVFVMPSYREGFGSSVIEASCLGIPVICSDAYGIMDAMVDGKTGLRCKVADVVSLREAMERLLNDADLRERLGQNGRRRVLDKFQSSMITTEWVKYYDEILKN